ncbi:MAG: TonB-dependent receptor [Sphingobium sp.]
MRQSFVYAYLGPIIFGASVPTAAIAQDMGPAQPQEAQSSGGLADIVVTAQRRSESLQDVPVAVAAFDSETLTKSGVTDTTSLNGQIPSLSISTRGPQNVIFIRGVGSNGSGVQSEQSVANYVDGVYIYSSVGNMFPLNNVERVEVLKGPQGTLFGRNATGGVINIITREPQHEAEVGMSLGYANYETINTSFYGTAGLTDTIAADLSISYKNQNKGWGRNITRNEDVYLGKDLSIRSKVLWEPTDRTKVRLIGAYTYQNNSGFNVALAPGEAGVDGIVRDIRPYDQVANHEDGFYARSYMGSLQIEQDFDFARLVSITAYRKVNATYITDQDGTPLGLVDVPYAKEPSSNWQQEVRLEGASGGPLEWMIGGFYFKSKATYTPLRLQGLIDDAIVAGFQAAQPDVYPTPAPGVGVDALDEYGTQKISSKSIFGQVSYSVTPTTKLTAGLRYTWEKVKRVDARNDVFYSDGTTFTELLPEQSDSNKKLTFRFAADQKFTDDIMGYASFSRGYKTGGYNLTGVGAIPAFQPEQLDAYEVGLKTELFDRHLRFNISAFYYKYKNIQVQLTQPGGENTANAAAARMKGVDVDFQVAVAQNFTLRGAAGYLTGKYREVIDPTTGLPFTLPGYPASSGAGFEYNPAGNRTVYSPKWSGNVGGTYTIPSSIGDFDLDATMIFSGKSFVQPTNRRALPSYKTVNSSITWKSLDDHLNIRVWAQNLFDERYLVTALESGLGDLIVYAPPRTYGVTLTTKF